MAKTVTVRDMPPEEVALRRRGARLNRVSILARQLLQQPQLWLYGTRGADRYVSYERSAATAFALADALEAMIDAKHEELYVERHALEVKRG